jgi:2'-5' RNA ligase
VDPQPRRRLFVALELPPSVRRQLAAVAAQLGEDPSLRAAPARNLHLTVAFLGERDQEAASRMAACVRASRPRLPRMSAQGLGAFAAHGEVQVVYAKVGGDLVALHALADAVAQAARALGMALDPRPYVPHITLARSRSGRGDPRARMAALDGQAQIAGFESTGLVLLASVQAPEGSRYVELARAGHMRPSTGC